MQPTLPMLDEWTFDDLQEIDIEDWRRLQIIDGALLVSPSASSLHEYVITRLRDALAVTAREEFVVLGSMGVGMRRSYLVPDLFVCSAANFRVVPKFDPQDAELVIEVESPSSVTTDRVLKAAKYAEAGIAHYWRVESDPVRLSAYTLPAGGSVYAEVGSWGIGETAVLTEPFPVSIEITRLQPPITSG